MTVLALIGLAAAAVATFGGGQYVIVRNGERWSAEQQAAEQARAAR